MRQVFERVVMFLVVIVVLAWGTYHAFRFAKNTIQLETVFQDSISRSLTGKGVAIRQEQPLYHTNAGTVRFLYEDGTRVGIDQPVVEFYSGDVDNRVIQKIRSIDNEIEMLKNAQNRNLNNFASAPAISRDIREQLSQITLMSSTGKCEHLPAVQKELRLLVNRRQVATGKSTSFEERIQLLEEERKALKSKADLGSLQIGYSPVSGYFAKKNDNLETKLSPEMLEQLTVGDYSKLVEQESQITNSDGRIVTSSRWFFAVCVPSHKIEWVAVDQKANLRIPGYTQKIPTKVYKVLLENQNDTAVIILSCDLISEDILNLRISNATIEFKEFTGLKIDSSYLHFRQTPEGEERGVYVLENHVVKFKKIDPIYEDPNFVLSRLNYVDSQDKSTVRLFDQIIVKGNDLYEGKVIE